MRPESVAVSHRAESRRMPRLSRRAAVAVLVVLTATVAVPSSEALPSGGFPGQWLWSWLRGDQGTGWSLAG
jgi:hypothetical protein